jgi:hypothetical protein
VVLVGHVQPDLAVQLHGVAAAHASLHDLRGVDGDADVHKGLDLMNKARSKGRERGVVEVEHMKEKSRRV